MTSLRPEEFLLEALIDPLGESHPNKIPKISQGWASVGGRRGHGGAGYATQICQSEGEGVAISFFDRPRKHVLRDGIGNL